MEIIIKPNRSWFSINWRDLLHYRDLLLLLVKRDFAAQYKQTILGPLWFVIQPLLMTLVFTVIFARVPRIATDRLPPMLFYFSGLVVWRYFADCLNKNSTSFVANAGIFGKVYFPRLIVPLSVIVSSLFSFLIQFGTFLAFYFYYLFFTGAGAMIHPHLFILLLPLFLVQTAMLGLGFGLWLSALTAKYRDLSSLMGFVVQLWMYATPIIYPLSLVPAKWKFLVAVNPMAPIVEIFKYAFLGAGSVDPRYLLLSIVMTLVLFFSGILIFNRVERTFIDTV